MRRSSVLVIVSLAMALAVGCGEETTIETTVTTMTETMNETTASADALTCLEEAGLSDVEQRDVDFWRGYNSSPFYQVSVERFPSPAEARRLVTDAVDIYAVQAGEYAVKGPARPSAGGLVTDDEAREAQALLQEVASCLGG